MGIGAVSLVTSGSPSFGLRSLEVRDLDAVVAIEEDWAPSPWSRDTFRRELDIPFSRSLVACRSEEAEAVRGYLVRWLVAGEVHLLSLAVDARVRRRGIGQLLLDELLAEARAEDASLVTLEVEESNGAARGLYASRGFEEVRRRRDYYGPGRDALVLDLRPGCRVVS